MQPGCQHTDVATYIQMGLPSLVEPRWEVLIHMPSRVPLLKLNFVKLIKIDSHHSDCTLHSSQSPTYVKKGSPSGNMNILFRTINVILNRSNSQTCG